MAERTTEALDTPQGDDDSIDNNESGAAYLKKLFLQIWSDRALYGNGLYVKIGSMLVFLVVVNIIFLTLMGSASFKYGEYSGLGLLAYFYGLRHAVDADHIAAIDNVVRKLVQEGKQPVSVGFFFSLGHSTIVFIMSCVVAFVAPVVKQHMDSIQNVGGLIGTSVSASFLFLIGVMNLIVLITLVKTWSKIHKNPHYDQEEIEEFLAQRGFMNRICSRALKLISKSWHMYFLGLLFGLGFDTATEVALLGISAQASNTGFPWILILLLPCLFAAGMTILDTLDGILMIWCYGWAFIHPVRKLFYNIVVTSLSILVAFVIGFIEVLSIIQAEADLSGPFWDFIANMSSTYIGITIIALFLASIVIATIYYKYFLKIPDLPIDTEKILNTTGALLDDDKLKQQDAESGTNK